jgi:ABC-type transport system substrate-binding protein
LSLAYNVSRRVRHSGNQLLPAQGPIPPGVAGYDENFRNPFAADDLEKAKKLLAEAGYPGGIDPATGERLRFTFDQSGNSSAHRQYGELAAADFAKLGIEVESVLNNNARFYEKLRQGKLQMFRLSWVGDFPDAENFLQLFYSKNSGGCNRTGFADPEYDRMYEAILPMPDSPERTALYQRMVHHLTKQVPWIFEGFPLSYQLNHAGLQNYLSHDFAFGRYKYLVFRK